jgi:integrase
MRDNTPRRQSALANSLLLLAQNVPTRVVMEILGHSQLAMTTDLYSHVMPTALRAAADAMDRVLVQPN